MHSNFRFTLRHLPDGNVLLCDGQGAPVLVDAQGRIRVDSKGQPMIYQAEKSAPVSTGHSEETKVPLAEYRPLIKKLYQPRLNLRTQQLEINGTQIDEAEFEALHVHAVEKHSLRFRKGDFQAVCRALALQASYDPVEAYIKGLGVEGSPILTDEEWDQIAVLALGLADSWSRTVVQKLLLSAVARVMDPGCKVDTCPILFGKQGLGKSTFFRALAGEWFSDSMGDLSDKKDDLMIFHRNWFNEWSEADQIFVGANKAEKIKRMVSAQEDSFRAPYGRTTQTFPRRSILVGTTNRDDWANDPTGNRRFPVLSPTAIDTDWITTNRDRIWARVAVEWRRGAQWWFSKEEEQLITEQASRFGVTNDDVEVAFAYLCQHRGEWVSTRDLLIQALNTDSEKLDHRKVSGFARQMSGLQTRGVLKEKRNYQGRTSQSPSRINTTCWMAVPSDE